MDLLIKITLTCVLFSLIVTIVQRRFDILTQLSNMLQTYKARGKSLILPALLILAMALLYGLTAGLMIVTTLLVIWSS